MLVTTRRLKKISFINAVSPGDHCNRKPQRIYTVKKNESGSHINPHVMKA